MTSNNSYSLHKRRYAQISIKVFDSTKSEKKGFGRFGGLGREKLIRSRKKASYKSFNCSFNSEKIQ